MVIRMWQLWAIHENGERILLNKYPFIGNASEAGCEADRLSFEIDSCSDLELESLGIVSKSSVGKVNFEELGQ